MSKHTVLTVPGQRATSVHLTGLIFFFFFFDREETGSHYVDQASLELRDLPVSTSWD